MEYYRQDHAGFVDILAALTRRRWTREAVAANLGPLLGRRGHRGNNDYNQWRTVLPYLGSLAVWCLSGQPSAPGNRHVNRTDHTNNGQNVHLNLNLTDTQKEGIRNTVRSLFPYPEVQEQRNRLYTKYMVIIDRPQTRTYLFILKWNHGVHADLITITLRVYRAAPPGHVPDMNRLQQQFERLGFR